MPLPEEDILQQSDLLTSQREPGFVTEDLASPNEFDVPQMAPIPIPGTGATSPEAASDDFMGRFKAQVLGATDHLTPGRIPIYKASDIYSPRYKSVLPGEDSEEAFGKAQPWYDKWGNALVKFGANTVGTFWNTVTAIPDTISSINGGQAYDSASGNEIDTWLKNLEDQFPNYYTKWQQDHPFMSAIPFSGGFANFWGDKFLKNLGFAVGALGGAVATDIAVGAVTEGVGAIPLVGAQFGKAALWLNKIFTGTDKVADLLALGRAAGRTPQQLIQLESLARAAAATRIANGTRFAINLYGATAAEAGMEARDAYNTIRQDLIQAYQRDNGYSPTGKELQELEKYARAGANMRFGANLALIGISNAVLFDQVLKPFIAARAGFRSSIQKELAEGAGTIGLREGSIDTFERIRPTGFLGRAWEKVRPLTPALLIEGVYEEGGQFATQVGVENYYERKYLYDKGLSTKQYAKDQTPWNAKDQMDNVIHSIVRGMSDEFGTDEGLENVLLGSLTGALFGGVGRYLDREQSTQNRLTTINALNSVGVTGNIKHTYDAAITAQRISEDMKEAVRTGDIFKYKNFQHEQFVNFVLSGAKVGRFDVRMEQINLLTGMSDEDFKKAFGLDKTTENLRTAAEYLDLMKEKAFEIKKIHDLVGQTFVNPFPFNRKATTRDEVENNQRHLQFEDWKGDLTFLSSIPMDVQQRLNSIETEIRNISQYVSVDQVAELTSNEGMKAYLNKLKTEAATLSEAVQAGTSLDKSADTRRLNAIKRRVEDIELALAGNNFTPEAYKRLFTDLLNYRINGENIDYKVLVPVQGVDRLMELGRDINRLRKYSASANEAFEKLSTREGFEKYFKDIQKVQEQEAQKPPPPATGGTPPTPPPTGPVTPTSPPAVFVKNAAGEQRAFDSDKDYLVNVEGKADTNPEPVKVLNTTGTEVTVQKADGTQVVIPADRLFKDDPVAAEVTKNMNEVAGQPASPPPQEEPANQPATKEGDFKKDISFGLFSTTDPVYSDRSTPFENFQRRHQNFLYNLGSSDPELFVQENKGKLRLIPVTAHTQEMLGFPSDFIADSGDNADESTIRAVYVLDLNGNAQETYNEIIEDLRTRQPNMPGIYSGFPLDGEFIDFIYEQGVGITSAGVDVKDPARNEMIKLVGEDLLDKIVAYKQQLEYYFVDVNGRPANRITDIALTDRIVFTTFSTTDLQFGETRQDRYTNKTGIDEVAAQNWWREQRRDILAKQELSDIPIYQFDVSRGHPYIFNIGVRNGVVDVGLIREEDLDKAIITVPTIGNVAIMGAYNEQGEGIRAAKEGVNIPVGRPMLNFGGNLVWLNWKRFSPSEAENIFQILKIISDRTTKVDKAPLFRFLNKIIYLGNPSKGIQPAENSITIQGNELLLGKSRGTILMTPDSLEQRKAEIIEFLLRTFMAINTTEINRIAKDPKANDLQFNELKAENGQIKVARTWRNYNHFLLSSKDPQGGRRTDMPLATNIAIPQPGEVPIIQKYAVLRNMEMDATVTAPASIAGAYATRPLVTVASLTQPTNYGRAEAPRIDFNEIDLEATTGMDELLNGTIEFVVVTDYRGENAQGRKVGTVMIRHIDPSGQAHVDQFEVIFKAQPTTATTLAPDKNQEQAVQQTTQQQVKVEWIEVDLGNGPVKLGFTNVQRDAQGNITDFIPAGRIEADNTIVPFKNPDGVKQIILGELKRSQVKPDETNTTPNRDWLNDGGLKKDSDPQYRMFMPGTSYKRGDVDEEFRTARRMVGDDALLVKVRDILKATGGGFAYGAFQDNVIYVWEGAKVGTTYHEVFEKVFNTFLKGKEQQELYDEFKERQGTFQGLDGKHKTFNSASFHEAKEQMAEEFTEYIISGELPKHPRQRSFFRRLLDFIKKIIFGTDSDINLLFDKINRGYYRNYPTSLRGPQEASYRRVGLEEFSEALVQDVLQGMTVEMLFEAYKEGADIISQLEENEPRAAGALYDKLKARLTHYFENTQRSDTLAAEIKDKYDKLSKEDDRQGLLEQYDSILAKWLEIKGKWEAFVKEHEQYLRIFNIEFAVDDEGNITFADEVGDIDYEDQNMSEYARDIFRIDAKNSASAKVKLLIATLADSVWRHATQAALGAVRSNEISIKREASQMALPKQVQYAKLFNYILHNTANINGIYEIWQKLQDLTSDPQRRKAIDANVQRLLNRVQFNMGFSGKTSAQSKLILSLENALAKQKPAFFRQFVDIQRNVYFKTSVLNSKLDQIKAAWIAGVKGSDAIITAENNQLRFSPAIMGIADNIQFLNRIGINITRQEYAVLSPRDTTRFNNAANKIKSIVEKAARDKAPLLIESNRVLDFESRLDELADIYVTNIVGEDAQSQHPNLDNEPTSNFVLNNFVSTILSDANNSATREEFIERQDNQYFKDIFHRDSLLLSQVLFDENGNFRRAVEIGVVEGRQGWDGNNASAASLTEAERQLYEINNNLNGVFYTLLPADAKTEWAVFTGTYLSAESFFGDATSRGNESTRFATIMYKWLQTEVELARDFDRRKDVTSLQRKMGDRTVGNSLRFFADLLPKETVDLIHKEAVDNIRPLHEIFTQQDLRTIMLETVRAKAADTLKNLVDWNVIGYSKVLDNYTLNGFDRNFLDNYIGRKVAYTEAEAMRLLAFREMNYMINNIEMHKFFFGDPAQYKDELKRIKSFLSGREATHVDSIGTSQGFNQWANEELNRVEGINLKPGDPGYHTFKNNANTLTAFDVDFESASLPQIEKAIGETAAKPYKNGNEADAQAYIMPTAYREVLWKAGGRFTAAQERQFQWEMAWERLDKEKDGLYTYTDNALKKADQQRTSTPPEEDVFFPILKLIHSGIQFKDGFAMASLDKASWAPMFYSWVKGRALAQLYNTLQEKGTDYLRMESAHKVGIQKTSSANLYTDGGEVNVEGLRALQNEAIPYKQFGIQVEQTKKEKGQTEGSQLRKIIVGDLRDNGVPIDFQSKYSDNDIAYNEWNELNEEQKLEASSIYTKIKRHDNVLTDLVTERTLATMRRLGIEFPEGGTPYVDDRSRISDFVLKELERRELPRNIAYGLKVSPVTNDFEQPLEANAQYSKIRSIIYSVIEKTIMRPKVNGGQKTMLAVTGWERSARIVKRMVNGKPVFTSSDLSFYTQSDTGTEACEIMLPYWFGKKLREMGSGRTKEEVLDYLNNTAEGQKLLRGIGFRIPTQGLNSIDFFRVKDFLPEHMGDVVVFPSEITVKAGSDFDIDKMNMYLYNFYIDPKDGYPHIVEWKGTKEATKEYIRGLITAGAIIPKDEREELDRIIAEETADVDPADFFMKVPGVADLFSEEQFTKEFFSEGFIEKLVDKVYLQALENEMFDSITELLALPENYSRLVTPNDASELKNLRTELKEIKGIGKQEDSLGTYGRLLDSNFMMKERQAYLFSKGLVGKSAVSQTAHAVSQNLKGGLVVEDPSFVARFPHNTIAGKVSLSGLRTAGSDNLISNINSQTTDGGVDVSKDKFLAEMGITNDTVTTFLAMVRMGASAKWAVWFLNQPIIQEFLKAKAIHSSIPQINRAVQRVSDRNLIGVIQNRFGGARKQMAAKPKVYTIKEMEEMMGGYYNGDGLTPIQNNLQIMILDDFISYNTTRGRYEGYSALAWELFHFYQGFNWDTARLNDPNAIRLKQLKFQKAGTLMVSSVQKVMDDTFIGAMKENALQLNEGLKSVINVQMGAAGTILDQVARDVYLQRGLNEETRKSILMNVELAMVDFAVQTTSTVGNKAINAYIHALLLSEKPVARYIQALQRSNDKRIANNPFIKNLVANIDTRQGYPSTIELGERDYDTYTSNVWTDAFREMMDDALTISINDNSADSRSVAQIYKNLVLTAIIQSGSKRTSNSLSHLIPNETYSEFTRTALQNMNLQGFYENGVIYRVGWADTRLVPFAEAERVDIDDFDSGFIHVFIRTNAVLEAMKDLAGTDRYPTLLHVPAWKYSNNKALKIIDPTTGIVRLFLRMDVRNGDRSVPLSVQPRRIVFKEVNPWGGGRQLQEYYDGANKSVLPTNNKVDELTDEAVIYALYKGGLKSNAAEDLLNAIVDYYENPGGSEEGNSPDDDTPPFDEKYSSIIEVQSPSDVRQIPKVLAMLQSKFEIPYEIINDPDQNWNAKLLGRFPTAMVTVNMAYARTSDPFHEYAHGLLGYVRRVDEKVFNDLYNTLETSPEWSQLLEDIKPLINSKYLNVPLDELKEELLAQAIGWAASKKYSSFSEKFKRFLRAVLDYLRGMFGIAMSPGLVYIPAMEAASSLETLVKEMINHKTRIAMGDLSITYPTSEIPVVDVLDTPEEGEENSVSTTTNRYINDQQATEKRLDDALLSDSLKGQIAEHNKKVDALSVSENVKKLLKVSQRYYKPRSKVFKTDLIESLVQSMKLTLQQGSYETMLHNIQDLGNKFKSGGDEDVILTKHGYNFGVTSRFLNYLMKNPDQKTDLTKAFSTADASTHEKEILKEFYDQYIEQVKQFFGNKPIPKSVDNKRLTKKFADWLNNNYGIYHFDTTPEKFTYGMTRLSMNAEFENKLGEGYEVLISNGFLLPGYYHNENAYFINTEGDVIRYNNVNSLGWYIYHELDGNIPLFYEFQSDVVDDLDEFEELYSGVLTSEQKAQVFRNQIMGNITSTVEHYSREKIENELQRDFKFSIGKIVEANFVMQEIFYSALQGGGTMKENVNRALEKHEAILAIQLTEAMKKFEEASFFQMEPRRLNYLIFKIGTFLTQRDEEGYKSFLDTEMKQNEILYALKKSTELAEKRSSGIGPLIVDLYSLDGAKTFFRSLKNLKKDRSLVATLSGTARAVSRPSPKIPGVVRFSKAKLGILYSLQKASEEELKELVDLVKASTNLKMERINAFVVLTSYRDIQEHIRNSNLAADNEQRLRNLAEKYAQEIATMTGKEANSDIDSMLRDLRMLKNNQMRIFIAHSILYAKAKGKDVMYLPTAELISRVESGDPWTLYVTPWESDNPVSAKFYKQPIGSFYEALASIPDIKVEYIDHQGLGTTVLKVDISKFNSGIERFSKLSPVQKKAKSITPTPASKDTIRKIREFLTRININIEEVGEIRLDGVKMGINGMVDPMAKLVQYVKGKEDITLPEESMHIAVELIRQSNPTLFRELMSAVNRYDLLTTLIQEYKDIPYYQTSDGKPDIVKLKKEAIAKILAQTVINMNEDTQENPEMLARTVSLWQKIVDFLKWIFGRAKMDPFEEATTEILQGRVIGELNVEPGTGIFLQTSQTNMADQVMQTNANLAKRASKYELYGEPVRNTVDEQVADFAKTRIFNRPQSDIAKANDEFKKESENKAKQDIEDIVNRLVDDAGNIRATPLPQVNPSALNPYNNTFYNTIEAHLKERIYQYPAGTRIFSGVHVHDDRTGTAATIDFLAIAPDGKVDILQFKIPETTFQQGDITRLKQEMYNFEIEALRRILQNGYGVSRSQFQQTRAIPIKTVFEYSVPGEPTSGLRVSQMLIGSTRVDLIEDNVLLPVPSASETTGNEQFDTFLGRLRGLLQRLSDERVPPERRFEKSQRLAALSASIRKLQVQRKAEGVLSSANLIVRKQRETYQRLLDQINSMDLGQASVDDMNRIAREIMDEKDQIELYVDLYPIFRRVFNDNSDTSKEYINSARQVSDSARDIVNDYWDMAVGFRTNKFAAKVGIRDEFTPEKNLTWYRRMIRSLSQSSLKAGAELWELVKRINNKGSLEFQERLEVLKGIEDRVTEWMKGKGVKELYNKIFAMNDQGRWTGGLIQKYSRQFYSELRTAQEKEDLNWVTQNIDVDAYNAWFKQRHTELVANSRTARVHEDDEQNRKLILSSLQNFVDTFYIGNKRGVNSRNYKLRDFPKEGKWESDAYTELQRPENAPVMELYVYWQEKLRESLDSGMIDEHNGWSWFPNVRRNLLEKLTTAPSRGKLASLFGSIRIEAEDQELGKIDPLTQRPVDEVHANFVADLGQWVKDADERYFLDYSEKSMDVFKVMALWEREIVKFKLRTESEALASLIAYTEENRDAYKTTRTGGLERDRDNKPIKVSNDLNYRYIKEHIDAAYYGKSLDAESDIAFSIPYKAVAERVNKLVGSEIIQVPEEETIEISGVKALNAINRFFVTKTLGLNLRTALANLFGGTTNTYINQGRYFDKMDIAQSEMEYISGMFWKDEKRRKMAGLLSYLFAYTDDRSHEQIRNLSVSKAVRYFSSDHLFIAQRGSDIFVNDIITMSFIKNTLLIDGKLINMREYAKKELGHDTKYATTARDAKAFERRLEARVDELKNSPEAFLNLVRIEDDRIIIPGLERTSDAIVNYRQLLINISRDALGNTSRDDLSLYKRSVMWQSFFMFKNWIPRMADVRFQSLKHNPGSNVWEWGRMRMLGKAVLALAASSRLSLMKTLAGNQEDMITLAKQTYKQKQAYFAEQEQDFDMSEAEFIDTYIKGVRAGFKELQLALAMMGILIAARMAAPDEDEEPEVKGAYKWALRALDKLRDEISFFYNPISFTSIVNGSVFPAVSLLVDVERFLTGAFLKVFYRMIGEDEEADKQKVAKYLFRIMPITKELITYLAIFNDDMAKEYGIRISSQYGSTR